MTYCSGNNCNRRWNLEDAHPHYTAGYPSEPVDGDTNVIGGEGEENGSWTGYSFIRYRVKKSIWFLKQVYNLIINGQWEPNRPYVMEMWSDESGNWKKLKTWIEFPLDKDTVIKRVENGMALLTGNQFTETVDYIKRNLK